MASAGARMRLSVEVLPLAPENARGPYQAAALKRFKEGRKFALPVRSDSTFEQVWGEIEQRCKDYYVEENEFAFLTFKKLQDAYDCDLDLRDTVADIFECEHPTNRRIKVVLSFVNRDFSVPPTSHLRPGYAQKRPREIGVENVNKRRRLEEKELQEINSERNVPVPSTESAHSDDNDGGSSGVARTNDRSQRSRSRNSLVITGDSRTGDAEFGPAIKDESPELGLPPMEKVDKPNSSAAIFKTPLEPASRSRPSKSRSVAPRSPSESIQDRELAQGRGVAMPVQEDNMTVPETDLDEGPVAESPVSNPEPMEIPQNSVTTKQRPDVYDVPSSPDIVGRKTKKGITYGRSPKTPRPYQKEADLLNHSRTKSSKLTRERRERRLSSGSLSSKDHAFQAPKLDEIVSTPQGLPGWSPLPESQVQNEDNEDDNAYDSFVDGIDQSLQSSVLESGKYASTKQEKPGKLKTPSKPLQRTPKSNGRDVQTVNPTGGKERRRRTSEAKSTTSISSTASKQGKPAKTGVLDILATLDQFERTSASPKVAAQTTTGRHGSKGSISVSRLSQSSPAAESSTARKSQSIVIETDGAKRSPQLVEQPTTSRNVSRRSEVLPKKREALPPKNERSNNGTENVGSLKKPTSKTLLFAQQGNKNVELAPKRTPVPPPLLKSATSSTKTNGDIASSQPPAKRDPGHSPKHASSPSFTNSGVLPSQPVAKRSRGRPRKDASSSSITNSVVLPSQPVTKRGVGRPPKNASSSATTNSDVPSSEHLHAPKITEGPTEPIVLSSGEPSPSYETSEDEDHHKNQGTRSKSTQDQVENQELDNLVQQTQPDINEAQEDVVIAESLPDPEPAVNESHSAGKNPSMTSQTPTEPQNGHDKIDKKASDVADSDAARWNTESWSFDNLNGGIDGTAEDTNQNIKTRSIASSRSSSAVRQTAESESGAGSARSSPAAESGPARFLSRTPTPKALSEESESEEYSTAPSRGASAKPSHNNAVDISDSDSSTSDSSQSENEDTEMPDAKPHIEPEAEVVPSSPPDSTLPPQSTPLVLESSQPTASQVLPRKTPVPLPRSSQSVSQLAAERRATYKKFPSIKQQLSATRAAPVGGQQKAKFDPRTSSLGKLMKGAKGKGKGSALSFGDSSSDDESSSDSSSSSSSEDEGKKAKAKAKNGKIRA